MARTSLLGTRSGFTLLEVIIALAIMTLSYKSLGQDKLAGDTERVLKLNYPDHPYFTGNWPSSGHWWNRMIPFRS